MLLLCDLYPLLIYPMQHRYHSDTTLNVLLTFTQKHSMGILGILGISFYPIYPKYPEYPLG